MAVYKIIHVEVKPNCKGISQILHNKENVPLSVRVFREKHHSAFSYYSPGMPGYTGNSATYSKLVDDLNSLSKNRNSNIRSKLVDDLANKKI